MNYYNSRILANLTENQLLALLNKRYPNIKKIEDEFSKIDCFDASTETHYELKCRRDHYETMFIEKDKYDALVEKKNAYYVTSTPKGIYMFNIKDLEEPVWRSKYLPHTTDFNKNEWIEKQIGEFQIKHRYELTQLLI